MEVITPYLTPRGEDQHRFSFATMLIPETEEQ